MMNSSLIQDAEAGGWWQFQDAREIIVVTSIDEVLPKLREIERRVERDGLWAAGFISYEAGPAFGKSVV